MILLVEKKCKINSIYKKIFHFCALVYHLWSNEQLSWLNSRKNKIKSKQQKISLTKKFYLNVDISSLFKTDMIYIVNNYNLPINYIENDFRNKLSEGFVFSSCFSIILFWQTLKTCISQ